MTLILIAFAFVFATIAAIIRTEVGGGPLNIHFGWLAVAFWILSQLVH